MLLSTASPSIVSTLKFPIGTSRAADRLFIWLGVHDAKVASRARSECQAAQLDIITDGQVDVVIRNNTGVARDPGSGLMTVVVRKRLFG
ncbi:hypothetical protein [Mesorhizobium sp.]|uniref:hypothetical protein n=1 Tax=Mesorhizobium sp. TaxID=1871066 RepID=UPI000FE4A8BD|nr:hypothetical protein [Mesorhizobium sp.]RWB06318.1 MAG: hypothetical protein EOQ33_06310 [Mesorhizobium sp.]